MLCDFPRKIRLGATIAFRGALANVGYHLSDQTIGNILQEQGIEPAPDRKRQTTWKTFIQARMIFFGEESLRRAVRHFSAHYHEERSHQGLGNRLISPGEEAGRTSGAIERRERLGGLLQYYYRRAA